MAYVISVVNQKGGVGKTTTAINLSAYLALKNKKVLLIDLDPQGNATSGYGFNKAELDSSVYDILVNEAEISEVIQTTNRKNIEMCPTNINLAGAEVELVSAMSRETILKRALEPVRDKYDFVLIDCPPSLGILTINALAASSGVLVPIQGEYYALEGLTQLIDTINLVKRHLNPKIGIFGVVLTMYDRRTQLTRQVTEEVSKYFGDKVFQTVIPRNIRLAEAPSFGQTIAEYDPKSKGGMSYAALAAEVIKRAKREE
ncbi:MAG: ParA family protein [Clostridiales bacterium]|nr:ParA family protein [Clostridiales bacterium]